MHRDTSSDSDVLNKYGSLKDCTKSLNSGPASHFSTEEYTFDAENNEHVVSLIMMYSQGFFHGFEITTRDGLGNSYAKTAFKDPGSWNVMVGSTSYLNFHRTVAFQVFAASVGSGLICGWGARVGSWIDSFGFVFLKKVVSSSIDPIFVNLENYGVSVPNTAVVHFSSLCARDYKFNPMNNCPTNSQQLDTTTKITNFVENSNSAVNTKVTSLSMEFGLGPFKFGSKYPSAY